MSIDNDTLDVNPDQPNVNVGVIGHVSNGKTSIVQAISKKDTKQFKLEKKVGKTVKLGYANAKIWKCKSMKEPECYFSTDSSQYEFKGPNGEMAELVAHVSFVDSPGHHSLMSTMLNGTCVTDTTLLVEAVSNATIPAQQTLEHLKVAREESGLPIVSEIMDASQINEMSMDCIDVVQVGTRNFQNYTLLDALGELDIPILLKRGTWGTIDEILGAVERILVRGNEKVAICLRGVVGAPSYRHVFPSIRWAPDLMMIPALKELCDIPIIYDPSHSTGYRNFVPAISKAAIAV